MVRSEARTVAEYLDSLPRERRHAIEEVRRVILENLPQGYQEAMGFGMISYNVPLKRYPDTYNGKTLSYIALASQKNYISLYLNSIYMDGKDGDSFRKKYRATGKRMDIAKSCVRFRKLEDLPLELVAGVVAATPVDRFISYYEKSRQKK
jgi:hypothetical protein